MYKVYVNGDVLYDSLPVMEDDLRIYSPVLTLDKEGGTFEFTLPKNHPLWNVESSHHDGALFLSTLDQIVIHDDNGWIWEGFPSDYHEDYAGNYKITCTGALKLLEDVSRPLEVAVDVTKRTSETNDGFLKRAIRAFTEFVVNAYNDRLDEMKNRFSEYDTSGKLARALDARKIYCNSNSKFDVSGGIPPYHFSRILNFENCYDALQKRIIDDFGGYYYLTKVNGLLVINYRLMPEILKTATVMLGKNLIDYNVSEEFRIATSVIPRGGSYDENHPGESKWWMKDERSAFYDIEQRADFRWAYGNYDRVNGKMRPTGGSRIFLPMSPIYAELVKKYGMRDVIVEFDSVVAKYPVYSAGYDPGFPKWKTGLYLKKGDYVKYNAKESDPSYPSYLPDPGYSLYVVKRNLTTQSGKFPPGEDDLYEHIPSAHESDAYGWPFYIKEHTYRTGKSYKTGDRFFYTVQNKHRIYEVLKDHESRDNLPPDLFPSYYALIEDNLPTLAVWLSIEDYLGESPYWDTAETVTADFCYIQDYTQALRILGLNYLTNQQYNKLILEIEASKIDFDGEGSLSPVEAFGKRLPVSSDLFGKTLKPYEVTSVSITIDDDSQSIFTLGGEETSITRLIRERTR